MVDSYKNIQCIINSTPTSSKSTLHSVARAKSNAPPNPKKNPKLQIIPRKLKKQNRNKTHFPKRKLNHKNHNLITTNNNLFGFNNLLSIEGKKRIKSSLSTGHNVEGRVLGHQQT
jgi:hypothetical protein